MQCERLLVEVGQGLEEVRVGVALDLNEVGAEAIMLEPGPHSLSCLSEHRSERTVRETHKTDTGLDRARGRETRSRNDATKVHGDRIGGHDRKRDTGAIQTRGKVALMAGKLGREMMQRNAMWPDQRARTEAHPNGPTHDRMMSEREKGPYFFWTWPYLEAPETPTTSVVGLLGRSVATTTGSAFPFPTS